MSAAPLALLVCALALTACGDDDSGGSQSERSDLSLLYVVELDGGTARPLADGRYRLSLAPRGSVLAFSDRPERTALRISAQNFFEGWGERFGNDPPNAALESGAGKAALPLELLDARLVRGRVQIDARPLAGSRLPRRVSAGALFIDDAAVGCEDAEGHVYILRNIGCEAALEVAEGGFASWKLNWTAPVYTRQCHAPPSGDFQPPGSGMSRQYLQGQEEIIQITCVGGPA